jgi:hypothetical protein
MIVIETLGDTIAFHVAFDADRLHPLHATTLPLDAVGHADQASTEVDRAEIVGETDIGQTTLFNLTLRMNA